MRIRDIDFSFPPIEEAYQDCSHQSNEPDEMRVSTNLYSLVVSELVLKQRASFPLRFNNALILNQTEFEDDIIEFRNIFNLANPKFNIRLKIKGKN